MPKKWISCLSLCILVFAVTPVLVCGQGQDRSLRVTVSAGKEQIRQLVGYYLNNADLIAKAIEKLGFDYVGGDNAPYIWIRGDRDSWEFFDMLLNKAGVVCTPGAGFGKCGQGYIRLSAFNSHENVARAMERIRKSLA